MDILLLSSSLSSIAQVISVILLFLFVLLLAYFAARIAGSLQSNTLHRNTNIEVIEVFRLMNNKLIEIIRIGDRYFAIAVCKDQVNIISELNENEVKQHNTKLEPINFKNILDKIKNEKSIKNENNEK